MTDKTKKRHVKAIGYQASIEILKKMRLQAIREGRKTGEVLGDAIQLYLDSNPDDLVRKVRILNSK